MTKDEETPLLATMAATLLINQTVISSHDITQAVGQARAILAEVNAQQGAEASAKSS